MDMDDLINLSKKSQINVLKKNNNKWVLRDKRKIINDCNKMKKKIIRNFSTNLKNLSLKDNIKSTDLADINNKNIYDIDNIDTIINLINNNSDYNPDYIEFYSN
uniref:Uncharacterized protein n=1 Tax=viral metagenome TaxID=1070528 RepID=A0A6C0J3Q5_9ZZZZ